MAGVEILGVQQPAPMREVLDDAHIDRPAVHTDEGSKVVSVIGWTIAGASRAVGVEILYRNRIIAVAAMDHPRPDVEATHPEATEVSGFRRNIDAAELAADFELNLRAILEDGSRVGLGSIKGRHLQPAPPGPGKATPDATQEETSDAQARLGSEVERLIAAGLAGREVPAPPDPACLERLVLTARRVLVIGTAVGDFARAARALGAGMVDVLEPDGDVAQLERLITAHRDVSRVFFYECDIAAPDTYTGGYGLVLAPRGLEAIQGALPRIAKTTKMFVTSLPVSRGKLVVPDSLQQLFPHHVPLGGEGASNGRSGRKSAMVALSTGPEELAGVLRAGGAAASVQAAAR
jgi:hypothetical protein